ncbi:MAG: putative Peptidase [Geminicoccaceae bacterium]|nr:putative Peptidase [Geminicoccaceae bacterium]
MARMTSSTKRCLAAPGRIAQLCAGRRDLSVKAQLATGAVIFALSAWVTATSVGYLGNRHLLSDSYQEISRLEQAYADLQSRSELSTTALLEQVGRLEATAEDQRASIRDLAAIQDTLGRQLASRNRQLAGIAEQRNYARTLVGELEQAMAQVEDLMQSVVADKSALEERLEATRTRLAAVSQERDAGRQVEVGLRWQVAQLEGEVQQLRSRRETAQLWLKDWVLGSTEALEQLFVETGVDLEGLIERATAPELGQGGPLQVAALDPEHGRPTLVMPADPMRNNIERLSALQRLARTLPLASPLDHFELTSAYGKRRDPFTKGWAFHAGLDFSAASGSKILATAPGRVVHAGPAGPYGNMVEIDHGMGVVTRYGHLKSIGVAPGDEVQFREEIGVIGNTGRSTALHLHYEVRIDDTAYDPARFLDAGRLLVGIFANAGHDPADQG